MKRMIDDKITSKLSIENDVLEIDGAVNADKITGDEIVENMSGYSATIGTHTNVTLDNVYTSVVKNGNKLTIVTAVNVKRTASVTGDPLLMSVTLPNDIMSKLYPTTISGNQFLDNKVINAWKDDSNYVGMASFIRKESKVNVYANQAAINLLTANTTYYYRYEVTFLLSDNLIS